MEQDLTYKRLLDIATAAAVRLDARYSRFLNPAQLAFSDKAAREAGVFVRLWGGYEDAEYQMACFSCSEDGVRWPIGCLRAGWNPKYGKVAHRDLLGAVMGLGIERDSVGDIVMADDCAFIFATEDVGRYLEANLQEAGRVKLKLALADNEYKMPAPKGITICETVKALRLDALIAKVYGLGRERAKFLVDRGDVRKNHLATEQAGAKVGFGDLVSVRGHGRFRVVETQGETKSGRVRVIIFKYGS